ncbi:MAG: DUF2461 family protein [Acidimicrobiales bacterium]
MSTVPEFSGFDPEAVALLAELPGWDAERYEAHKAELIDGVTRPGLALITELANRFPHALTVAARSSVSPLHRDLRFAPDGAPRYKDHLLLTAWHGADKRTGPTMWLRVDAAGAGFASGVGFTPAMRERWRAAVGGSAGVTLADELDRLEQFHGAEVAGGQVKRVPRPFEPDHPRSDLLRRTGFQVRLTETHPDHLDRSDYADWCLGHWLQLASVHRWLVDHLAESENPR